MFFEDIKNSTGRLDVIKIETDEIAALISSGLTPDVDGLIRKAFEFNSKYPKTVDLIHRTPLNIINKITNMVVNYAIPSIKSGSYIDSACREVFFTEGVAEFLRRMEAKYPGYEEEYRDLAKNFNAVLKRIHNIVIKTETLDDSEIIYRNIKEGLGSGRMPFTIFRARSGEVADEASVINLTNAIFENFARDEILKLLNVRRDEIDKGFEIEKVRKEAQKREMELTKRIRDMEQQMMEMEIVMSKKDDLKMPAEGIVLHGAVAMSAPSSSPSNPAAGEASPTAKSTTRTP